MEIGAITEYIDAAQVVLYVFWVFFAYVIFYLIAENKREGYPLETDSLDPTKRRKIVGVTRIPDPKEFLLEDGRKIMVPDFSRADTNHLRAHELTKSAGFPFEPSGDPLVSGVGPGSYADRMDEPDLTIHGTPKIIPMRIAEGFHVDENDPNPIGMPVMGADDESGGTVTDLWIDPPEHLIRFLEVEVAEGRKVLFPINLCRISASDECVYVNSLLSNQMANIPTTKSPEQVTRLEEEKIYGYFGAGTLYATPGRREPFL